MKKIFELLKFSKSFIFITLISIIVMSSSAYASTVQSKTIKSIADINASVNQGDKYSLPATVTAVMSDNTKQQIAAAWAIDTGSSKQDVYIFEGTVSGYGKKVKLTVTAQKYIKSIADINVSVSQKDNYTLPSTVTAVMNDGSVRQATVTWNPAKADTSKTGTFKFQGTVQGYSSKVILTLIVTQAQEQGNTGGNITNGGVAMQKGDWIYYMNGGDYNKLYKININGTGKTKLNDDASYNINVVGGWIYFTNASDGLKLYKIKTDGTGKAKLSNDESNSINVVGNWIYYLSGFPDYRINKIKIDGTGKTQLNNYSSEVMNVSGDWIYYLGKDDNSIYKIKIDGTGNALLIQGWYENLIVMGDWIYFKDHYDHNVYKIKTNGTGKIKIINDSCNTFNVAGNWIYYGNDSDDHHLYKVKTDGTARTFLGSDWPKYINIAGDWIYYTNHWNWERDHYRMKTDGSNKQIIN